MSSLNLPSHSGLGTGWRSTTGAVIGRISKRSGGEDGLIADDRRAVHDAPLGRIMRRNRVDGAAIVPHQNVIWRPTMLVNKPRLRGEGGQIVDKRSCRRFIEAF